jgi:hypothetical protein
MLLPARWLWTGPLCLGLLCLFALPREDAAAAAIRWPDLMKIGHVTGRVATQDDVNAGNAAFAIRDIDGHPGAKPIRLTIPQYAMYVDRDTGHEVPVVVIQAEDRAGAKLAGFRLVARDGVGACLLSELRLLGTKRPP